jgi:hypothetical protein
VSGIQAEEGGEVAGTCVGGFSSFVALLRGRRRSSAVKQRETTGAERKAAFAPVFRKKSRLPPGRFSSLVNGQSGRSSASRSFASRLLFPLLFLRELSPNEVADRKSATCLATSGFWGRVHQLSKLLRLSHRPVRIIPCEATEKRTNSRQTQEQFAVHGK